MIIEVLVCRADGTQEAEQREVPDNWFDTMLTVPTETVEA